MSDAEAWAHAARMALALSLGDDLPGRACHPPTVAAAAQNQRIAVETFQGAVALGLPDLADELNLVAQRTRMSNVRRAAVAAQLAAVLDADRVPTLFFKGLSTSAVTRTDPFVRQGGDLDVLVPAERVVAVHRALVAAGAELSPSFPTPRDAAAYRFFLAHAQETGYQFRGETVDLHWQIGFARRTLPSTPEAFAQSREVVLGGPAVRTLSPRHALLHSALHWRHSGWRQLKYVVDLVALQELVDPGEVAAMPRSVTDVLVVANALSTSDSRWRPTVTLPGSVARLFSQAVSVARVPLPAPGDSRRARVRLAAVASHWRTTPDYRDRLAIPLRSIAGPMARTAERFRPLPPYQQPG